MPSIRSVAAVAAAALAAGALVPALAGADTTPTYFPKAATLDTTAYTLRLAGADRYDTAATLARVAAKNSSTMTGYPFNEADLTEPGKGYGFASCPKTVVVAAGDTVADALAASSIKDLSAVAVGGKSLDTSGADLLLTASTRQGATDLSAATITVLQDLKTVCGADSFDGVIFGSTAAVPANAETTLDALAKTVVRVSGADRFATAAAVAQAVRGAAGLPAVKLFSNATTSTSLSNTVFLAEGITGADALAVGPYAANKNVPILLTASGELPTATRNALLSLTPDNIVVLGGTGAISDDVAKAAAEAANNAKVTRISGTDRYDTSVKVAQQLFGIYAPASSPLQSSGAALSNLTVGFARSEGSGPTHSGYPDALASAFFLDTLAGKATPPQRLAPPAEKNAGDVVIGGKASGLGTPLLLVAATEVPKPVADYTAALYPSTSAMRTATTGTAANDGGFGYLFGGQSAITRTAELTVATNLSGKTYTADNQTDANPSLDLTRVFYTAADLSAAATSDDGGVDKEGATAPGAKVCALRKAITGGQFLAVYEDAQTYNTALPLDYQNLTGTAYPPAESRFQCADASKVTAKKALVPAVSLSGHVTTAKVLDWSDATGLLTTEVAGADPQADTSSGDPTTEANSLQPTGASTQSYKGTMTVTYKGTRISDALFDLRLSFTRTNTGSSFDGPDRLTFTGTITIATSSSTVLSVPVEGESATLASPLQLVGSYQSNGRRGAIVATVTKTGSTFALTNLVLDGQV